MFDPRKPGLLKIILDTGDNSYRRSRAIEFLKTELLTVAELEKAIQLLVAIIVDLKEPPKRDDLTKTREKDGSN